MAKRVYELAKDLGMSSRDVLSALASLGVVAKSHASTVDDDIITKLREAAEKGALKAGGTGAARTQRPARPVRPQRPPLERPPAERVARPPQPKQGQRPAPGRQPAAAAQPAPAPATSPAPQAAAQPAKAEEAAKKKSLSVHRGITLRELGEKMSVAANVLMQKLFHLGEMATINQSLADEAIEVLANEYGFEVKITSPGEEEEALLDEDEGEESPDVLQSRPPVITVMGHVDHGKTKLLDAIRETDVVAGEAGGITQHIGAYQTHKNGRAITFIDTPGHEAFTQMRARGAKATDIAVLVVAADDGVKPQTVEALNHAKAAGVPIVVAVNKVDKPEADPTRVRQQLTEHELIPEEWGGDTIFVDVSAKAHTNLDQLLEMLLLVADVQELKANPKSRARGVALEAHLDKGRGPVATLLVQRGTLNVGDAIVCGAAWARVRAMLDEKGRPIKDAGPGTPLQVLGFSTVPEAGDEFRAVADERVARQLAQERMARKRAADFVSQKRVKLEELFEQIKEGETTELNVILKADVQGSLEAIKDALAKIEVGENEVKVRVLHDAAGAITENDVSLAQASGAMIVGFNVRPDPKARELAEREKVEIRTYQVIYQLIEEVEAALKGMLKPIYEERVLGRAQVRQVFKGSSIGTIAGSFVESGTITRNAKVRLVRDGVVMADTTISSLRRFKDDVREVAQSFECGIGIENFQDIKDGDVLETYEIREIART